MVLLILGVLIYIAVHLFPSRAAGMRAACIERIGEGPYKGLFALSLVGAISLMVIGWQSMAPVAVYAPQQWGVAVSRVAMFISLVLFLGSGFPSNLKRIIRHPQLVGALVWSLAHLLANGDQRSLLLFGGIGFWTVVQMLSLNGRDGAWVKPEPLPLSAELKPVVVGIVGFVVLAFAHPYLFAVAAFPR